MILHLHCGYAIDDVSMQAIVARVELGLHVVSHELRGAYGDIADYQPPLISVNYLPGIYPAKHLGWATTLTTTPALGPPTHTKHP